MAPEVQETPFVKQLASSDRKTREDALESLRTYLLYNRHLTEIELLKLWRGLFFCKFRFRSVFFSFPGLRWIAFGYVGSSSIALDHTAHGTRNRSHTQTGFSVR
ncbi:hypothetical protein XPA_008899 [Xanthoria parietina]